MLNAEDFVIPMGTLSIPSSASPPAHGLTGGDADVLYQGVALEQAAQKSCG